MVFKTFKILVFRRINDPNSKSEKTRVNEKTDQYQFDNKK
jgi:hypothetical protein